MGPEYKLFGAVKGLKQLRRTVCSKPTSKSSLHPTPHPRFSWCVCSFQLMCVCVRVCRLASCDLNCYNHCSCSFMLVVDELNISVDVCACVCRLASCDLNCCNHCCCSSMLVEDELNMGVAYIWILYDVPSSVLCVVSWTTNTDFHVRLELFCLTMIIMTFGCWLDIKTAKISGFQGMHHNLLIRQSFLLLLLLFFLFSFSVIHSWCLVLYKIFVYVYYSWMDATVFPCRSFCGPTCIPNKRGFK